MFLSKYEIENFQFKISKRRARYDLNNEIEESIFKTVSNSIQTSEGLGSTSKRKNQLEKEMLKSTPSSAQKITQTHVIIPNHFVAKENRQSDVLSKPKFDFVSNSTCTYHIPRYIDVLGMLLALFILVNWNFLVN